jgi:hypothetical protein
MSEEHAAPRADLGRAAPAPIEWTFRPWSERPRPARLALASTAAIVVLLAVLRLPGFAVVILAAAVTATLAPAWTPLRCRVDETGVHARGPFGWERRPWSRIRRARVLPPGALVVSPYKRRRRLDRFRALVLPFPGAERDRLNRAVSPHLERHGY